MSYLHHRGPSEQVALTCQEESPHQDRNTLILASVLHNWEMMKSCYVSQPVCAVLLWQLEQTNTYLGHVLVTMQTPVL